jgi:hypothetical protein
MAGIKVTLRDPDDNTKLIHAEFATARSFPVLRELLQKVARTDTAESISGRKRELAEAKLLAANTSEEAEAAGVALQAATEEVTSASMTLFDAIREFVFKGYQLAGAPAEMAEKLADITDVENLPILKAKCLFGAGCLDFTKAAGR